MENVQEKAASPSNGNGKDTIEIKSKFDAEFRRFSLNRRSQTQYEDFQKQVEELYKLQETPFIVCYTDIHGDLLPVNNDDNYMKALSTASPLLRIIIQRKGESYGELNGYGSYHRKRNPIISKLIASEPRPIRPFAISLPEDFRRVSAIIDVDVVPETCRRVKLMKNGSDKPLGFYIRDGTSVRVTEDGLEKVAGIFISRLVPGGLAEMTGLIAVNDEVLEVNGIEVAGKTLDQVTDMMVANSAKLIITVKPMNQRNTLAGPNRASTISHLSVASSGSKLSVDSDEVHVFNKGDTDSSEDTALPPSVEAAEIVLEEGYDEVDDGKEDKDSVIVTL